MKEITWTEAFSGRKGLRQIREENNLSIPQEYINSTWKLAVMPMFGFFVLGFMFGYGLGLISVGK